MGHIINPDLELIDDELYYELCGSIAVCDKTNQFPDSDSSPICFWIRGDALKEWFYSGKNGTCGPTPAGQLAIDYRFKGTSIKLWVP